MNTRDIEKDLLDNFKEFILCAEDELQKKRYNSSVAAYFKAVAAISDLNIYRKVGTLPKNHSDRFNYLEVHFPDIYVVVQILFKTYTDSYNLRMEKQDAIGIKQNVERIKELFKRNTE